MGRSRSTRRGEIRTAILALLVESPMHGYQIITERSERSGGDRRPSAGSVYPTLQQLTDEGLVRDEERDGRRVYELTDTGRVEAAKSAGATPPWQSDDKDGSPDLRRVAVQVMSATMQVAQDDDPAMQARAYELLADCDARCTGSWPTTTPSRPADMGPSRPADMGPSRPADMGPSRPADMGPAQSRGSEAFGCYHRPRIGLQWHIGEVA